jgi:hypothetical protein
MEGEMQTFIPREKNHRKERHGFCQQSTTYKRSNELSDITMLQLERHEMRGQWLQSTKRIPEGAEIIVHYRDNYVLEDNHTTSRNRRAND